MAAHGVAVEKAAGFLTRPPVRQAPHESLREEFKRRIKTQTVLCPESAEGSENRGYVVLGALGVRTNHHAQGRRLAKPRRNAS
jgi:hypothetical protein